MSTIRDIFLILISCWPQDKSDQLVIVLTVAFLIVLICYIRNFFGKEIYVCHNPNNVYKEVGKAAKKAGSKIRATHIGGFNDEKEITAFNDKRKMFLDKILKYLKKKNDKHVRIEYIFVSSSAFQIDERKRLFKKHKIEELLKTSHNPDINLIAFNLFIVDNKIAMIGFPETKEDHLLRKSIIIRNQDFITSLNQMFDSYIFRDR